MEQETRINVMTSERIQARLDRIEGQLAAIEKRLQLARWGFFAGQPEGDPDAIEVERGRFLLSPETTDTVEDALARQEESGPLPRRLELLYKRILDAKVEARPEVVRLRYSVGERFRAFRPRVKGREVDSADITHILRHNPDRQTRREAWEAMEPLAEEVRADTLALFRLRNSLAQAEGFGAFPDIKLAADGLAYTSLLEYYVELEASTRDAYLRFLDRACGRLGLGTLMPWDIEYALSLLTTPDEKYFPPDGVLEKVSQGLVRAGFAKGTRVAQVTVAPIPYGGICYDVEVPDDIRLLVNPRPGFLTYSILFHEFGHAQHFAHIQQPNYLFRSEYGCMPEGLAITVQRLALDETWLTEIAGVPEAQAEQLAKGKRDITVHRLRKLMADSTVELKAYADTDQDLARARRQAIEGFLMVPCTESCAWASDPFLALDPVYWHNYILGQAIASQNVERLMLMGLKSLLSPQFGEFLITHYFEPGNSISWEQRIRNATGKNLSMRAIGLECTA